MPASLPSADPPNSNGISSRLWLAHRGGDAGNGGGERAERDFENADDEDARTSTSTSPCSALADGCLRHPFLLALADGSLPLDSFRFYVAQGDKRDTR